MGLLHAFEDLLGAVPLAEGEGAPDAAPEPPPEPPPGAGASGSGAVATGELMREAARESRDAAEHERDRREAAERFATEQRERAEHFATEQRERAEDRSREAQPAEPAHADYMLKTKPITRKPAT